MMLIQPTHMQLVIHAGLGEFLVGKKPKRKARSAHDELTDRQTNFEGSVIKEGGSTTSQPSLSLLASS